ncbi:hypothetical protein V1477_008797 [Vespula maculifrons]|uniref:Uncharacterized protein n=1 Tax=Vespula maculifrons TaxID=7453 RepID=A0ABD2CE30_VESMC
MINENNLTRSMVWSHMQDTLYVRLFPCSLSLTFSITPTSASPGDLEDSNKLDVKRRKLVN